MGQFSSQVGYLIEASPDGASLCLGIRDPKSALTVPQTVSALNSVLSPELMRTVTALADRYAGKGRDASASPELGATEASQLQVDWLDFATAKQLAAPSEVPFFKRAALL